jgi:hypothetical protein
MIPARPAWASWRPCWLAVGLSTLSLQSSIYIHVYVEVPIRSAIEEPPRRR